MEREMAIKAVVFDIGNVLVGFDWMNFMRSRFDETTVEAVNRAMWESGIWNEMDRGILNEEEILDEMTARAPEYAPQIREAYYGCGSCITRKDYAIPWIEELKARGYRVLFLSNYSEHVKSLNPEALDFLPHMDGGVWSCDTGLVKPFRKIYRILMEKYSLAPSEWVFLDDNPANIAAARGLGIPGILFQKTDPGASKVELEAVLAEDGLPTENGLLAENGLPEGSRP